MTHAYIVGLGMIRFNKYPDRGVRDMAHEVTRLALNDAGLEKTDLQAAFFSNTFWGNVFQPAFHQRAGDSSIDGYRGYSGN